MDANLVSGFVLLVGMIIFLLLGLEVALSLGIIACLGLVLVVDQPINQLAYTSWATLNSFTLSAMPLFIFMGCILGNCGVNEYLFYAIDRWTGNLPGGLLCSVFAGNAVFAAMCGSTMAATATFGKIAFPVMEKKGYDASLSLGSIAAGSILAPLIPPSIIMIIYGSWQGISIVDLLAAGLIPGVILTVLFIATVMFRVSINPSLVPASSKYRWKEKISAITNVLPFVGLIVGVLGAIFFGVMTPSEAAGLGAFLSIVLTTAYKRLTLSILKESLLETTRITSFSLFIMAMASLLTHVFNSAGIIPLIKNFVIGLPVGKYTVLFFLFVMYFFMGMLFDSWSMLFLTFPFVMPIITALGFNPIWWGVVYVMAAEQGTITPPFGLSLFVLKSVAPQFSIGTIARGASVFLIPVYLNILLLIIFPELSLWLPRVLSRG